MTALEDLKYLDPARRIPADVAQDPVAQRTLMTAMNQTDTAGHSEPARKRRGVRAALVSAPLVAASSAAAFFALGTASTSPAFASWQATPTAPSAQEAARTGHQCVIQYTSDPSHFPTDFTVRLVEKRGSFTYVVLSNPKGWEATCFFQGDAAKPRFAQGFAGPLDGTPHPDGLVTNSVRQLQGDDHDDKWQEVTGRMGSNVKSVEFLANNTRVKATVKDGYFAAWWPGSQPRFRLHDDPPNPDVVITLKNGRHITKQIQDFDTSPQ